MDNTDKELGDLNAMQKHALLSSQKVHVTLHILVDYWLV